MGQKLDSNRNKSISPGAGSYDPDLSKVMISRPAYSLAKLTNQSSFQKTLGPGPSNYAVNFNVDKP